MRRAKGNNYLIDALVLSQADLAYKLIARLYAMYFCEQY